MREPAVNRVAELFGHHPGEAGVDWQRVVREQGCPLTGRACYKIRKSVPELAIGTCTVLHGTQRTPVMICPARLLQKRLAFSGCLHLLTNHEPGNELHVVPEVEVPGGQVDYFLASVRRERVVDFVGIEFQTLDTTGSVWPERQRLLRDLGVPRQDTDETSATRFGVNWKHTAKTTLVQMHHKIATFEHVNRRLVLVLQDTLLAYMRRNFDFGGLHETALLGDANALPRLRGTATQGWELRDRAGHAGQHRCGWGCEMSRSASRGTGWHPRDQRGIGAEDRT